MSESAPSISTWLERLRESDEQAARRLWEHFFARMTAVARWRLGAGPRRAADPGMPPLTPLARGLHHAGVEQVEMLSFPVKAKEVGR